MKKNIDILQGCAI